MLERVATVADADARAEFFGGRLPESEGPLTLAETINRTLGDLLAARPDVLVFGEDVGAKGGVYGVTRGLQKRAGAARVFDSLLDEQSILGIALGSAVSGLAPDPRDPIPRLPPQRRGSAAGRGRQPFVLLAGAIPQPDGGSCRRSRLPEGLRRPLPQRQRGGRVARHPRTRRSPVPAIRPTPRRCSARARRLPLPTARCRCSSSRSRSITRATCTRPATSGGWRRTSRPKVGPPLHVPIGEGRIARDGGDVLIVTWANGLYLSLRAAERLAAEGVSCRVLDMRWLAPLPIDQIVEHAREIRRVVVVDETRRSGGVGEAVARRSRRQPCGCDRNTACRRPRHVHPPRRCGIVRARQRRRHPRRRPRRRDAAVSPANCLRQNATAAV